MPDARSADCLIPAQSAAYARRTKSASRAPPLVSMSPDTSWARNGGRTESAGFPRFETSSSRYVPARVADARITHEQRTKTDGGFVMGAAGIEPATSPV
jgi:hypothetical protein